MDSSATSMEAKDKPSQDFFLKKLNSIEEMGSTEETEAPSTSESMTFPVKAKAKEAKGNLTTATKNALLNLSASASKYNMTVENLEGANRFVERRQTKTALEISHEEVTRKLLTLMEEDASLFTDFDAQSMLPSDPFPDNCFSKLRQYYEGILAEFNSAHGVGIPLEEVKEDFQVLWEGIQKSYKNLKNLMSADVELTGEVTEVMARTKKVIKVAQDDREMMLRLGNRLENAWKLLDISEEEDKKNTEKIEEYGTDIMILNRSIQIASRAVTKSNELVELKDILFQLETERDRLRKQFREMSTTSLFNKERGGRLEEKKAEFLEIIRYCNEEAAMQNEALVRETKRKEKLEQEIQAVQDQIQKKTAGLEEIEDYNHKADGRVHDLEQNVHTQQVLNKASSKDTEAAMAKRDKLEKDYDVQLDNLEKLAVATFKKQFELEDKMIEATELASLRNQAYRQLLANNKRRDMFQGRLDEMNDHRNVLKLKIIKLEKDLEAAQKLLVANQRKVAELDKKRTNMNQNLTRANAVNSEQSIQLTKQHLAQRTLEIDMGSYQREIETQEETIHQLEKERDLYAHEGTKMAQELSTRIEELAKMDKVLFDFEKKLIEIDGIVKMRQMEHDESLSERRVFEKLLRDTSSSIGLANAEVRHRTMELNSTIFINYGAESEFKKQKDLMEYLRREKMFFTREAERIKRMAEDMEREVESLEFERSSLGAGRANGDNELAKQRYYVMQAEARKFNYHRRLQKKEDELKQVWMTWRDVHSMLRVGAYHHRNIMAEIRSKRQDILQLRKLHNRYRGNVNHINELGIQIGLLELGIAKETCMVNALQNELQKPVNIHRWRALEVLDPPAYATVKKINFVTKRLVERNAVIQKQCKRIDYREKVTVDLREAIQGLPSVEIPELKRHYEVILKERKEVLKRLKVDLGTAAKNKRFYEAEIGKVKGRIKELKKSYIFDTVEKPKLVQFSGMSLEDSWRFQGEYSMSQYPKTWKDIDYENLDVATIKETYKTHLLQQESLEQEFHRRKNSLQEAKKWSEEYDRKELERERAEREGRAEQPKKRKTPYPTDVPPDDDDDDYETGSYQSSEGSSISSRSSTAHVKVKEVFKPVHSGQELFKRFFPQIKSQFLGENGNGKRYVGRL